MEKRNKDSQMGHTKKYLKENYQLFKQKTKNVRNAKYKPNV
jgi:hypothetical protein